MFVLETPTLHADKPEKAAMPRTNNHSQRSTYRVAPHVAKPLSLGHTSST